MSYWPCEGQTELYSNTEMIDVIIYVFTFYVPQGSRTFAVLITIKTQML